MDVNEYGISETFMGNFVYLGFDSHSRRHCVVSDVLWPIKGLCGWNAGTSFRYGKGADVTWERVCI